MLLYLFVPSVLVLILAYRFYGDFLSRKYDLNDENPTPSHTLFDNVDYVPTNRYVLFGHHFSSIAGAGPIVGPVLGALMFGWGVPLAWILLGSIFIGGVHDFSSIIASIRHKGRSIAEIVKLYVGKNAYIVFLLFTYLSLVYVLIAFADITATIFEENGEVASVSIFYILLAILFGLALYRLKFNLKLLTVVFVVLVFLCIYLGYSFPLSLPPIFLGSVKKSWCILLVGYMFVASVLPVWLLLQPRDYLSSFLLYTSVLIGFVGILFGNFKVGYPIFTSFAVNGQSIFPMLFVTIACGAISGFHSLVSSGTSSKQIDKESDARLVGYGGMLTEGVVALIALSTVIMLPKSAGTLAGASMNVFAQGIGRFLNVIGVPQRTGEIYGFLLLSAFVLTTLDTATRIARYTLQELLGWETKRTRFVATAITIVLPLLLLLVDIRDASGKVIPAYKAIWAVFGASNQLLAALVLLTISVWLASMKKKNLFTIIPTAFMLAVTVSALAQLIFAYRFNLIGIIAIVLFLLAVYLLITSVNALRRLSRDKK